MNLKQTGFLVLNVIVAVLLTIFLGVFSVLDILIAFGIVACVIAVAYVGMRIWEILE